MEISRDSSRSRLGTTVSVSAPNDQKDAATAGTAEILVPGAAIEECPLQTVVAHLARATLRQHVLYLEGECAPRADLSRAIDAWATLYGRIQAGVCPMSRRSTPDAGGLGAILVDLPPEVPEDVRGRLLRALTVCTSRKAAEGCPLTQLPEPRMLSDTPMPGA